MIGEKSQIICDVFRKFREKLNSLVSKIKIIDKSNLNYKALINYSKDIKKYRNRIVHFSEIHPIKFNWSNKAYVVRKEKIDEYLIKMHMTSVMNKLTKDDIGKDFMDVSLICNGDFEKLCEILNKSFKDINKEIIKIMYEDKNQELLKLFKIEVI